MSELIQSIMCCGKSVQLFDDSDTVPKHDPSFTFITGEKEGLRVVRIESVMIGECKICEKQFSLRTDFESAASILLIDMMEEISGANDKFVMPTYNGSRHCKSGSIASGGIRAHCTCNICLY